MDDVQEFNDADRQATISECAFSQDEDVVDVDSADEQPYGFLVEDDNEAEDEALGLS